MNQAQYRLMLLRLVGSVAVVRLVLLASVKGLNFDETLALRSGWLTLAGNSSEPPFWMPWTALVGLVGHVLDDPGHVYVAARLVTLIAWSAGGVLIARRHGEALGWILAVGLSLQQEFVAHGVEFRYDSGVTLGLLFSASALPLRHRRDAACLGSAVAWLLLHHIKGVYYAGWVTLLAAFWVWAKRAELNGPQLFRSFALVLSSCILGWCLVSVALGAGTQLFDIYAVFARLSTVATPEKATHPLVESAQANPAFWSVVVLALCGSFFARDEKSLGLRVDPARDIFIALTFASALFLELHPYPWSYLLVPVAVFGALSGARGLVLCAEKIQPAIVAAGVLTAGLVQWQLFGIDPNFAYQKGQSRTMDLQVEEMRKLRAAALSTERVVDPSGLAYFLRPCNDQWYLDSLFVEWTKQGEWMKDFRVEVAQGCVWAVHSQRFYYLPPEQKRRLERAFENKLVFGALIYGGQKARPLVVPESEQRVRLLSSYW